MMPGWTTICLLACLHEQVGGAPSLPLDAPSVRMTESGSPTAIEATQSQPTAPAGEHRGSRHRPGQMKPAGPPPAEIAEPGAPPAFVAPDQPAAPAFAAPLQAPSAANDAHSPDIPAEPSNSSAVPRIPNNEAPSGDASLAQALAETLKAAADRLGGRPLTLVEALAPAIDSPNRLSVIRAYWQLACAMLDFEFREQELALLQRFGDGAAPPPSGAANEFAAARAAAEARQQEARIAVLEAQQGLAGWASAPAGAALPVCADVPHTGPYRTKFDQLFANRSAPPQAWLLNRVLPLRHDEVAARGRAAQCAAEAVMATEATIQHEPANVNRLLEDLALLASVRRTLVQSVRQYNEEIADYALSVVDPQGGAASVAALLIKPRNSSPGSGSNSPTAPAAGVEQAMFEERLAPQRPSAPAGQEPSNQNPPAARPPHNAAPPLHTTEGSAQMSGDELSLLLSDTRLYADLTGAEPADRTERLVANIYRQPDAIEHEAPVTLVSLLQASSPTTANRRSLIADYWTARELAARRHVLADVAAQLESIAPSQNGLSMADQSVLEASRACAAGDLAASKIDAVAAQWRLSNVFGRPLDQAWLVPVSLPNAAMISFPWTNSTAPNAGSTAYLDQLHTLLVKEAAAIIELDASRSQVVAEFARQGGDVHRVLSAIGAEMEQSLALLSGVRRYNQQIADYALATLPPNASADLLASALSGGH